MRRAFWIRSGSRTRQPAAPHGSRSSRTTPHYRPRGLAGAAEQQFHQGVEHKEVVGIVSIGDLVKAVIDQQQIELQHLQDYIAS